MIKNNPDLAEVYVKSFNKPSKPLETLEQVTPKNDTLEQVAQSHTSDNETPAQSDEEYLLFLREQYEEKFGKKASNFIKNNAEKLIAKLEA
jgi:hypothetical protein